MNRTAGERNDADPTIARIQVAGSTLPVDVVDVVVRSEVVESDAGVGQEVTDGGEDGYGHGEESIEPPAAGD